MNGSTNTMRHGRRTVAWTVTLLATQIAHAQSTQPPTERASAAGLDEIVVTARKREESILKPQPLAPNTDQDLGEDECSRNYS